MIIVIVGAGIAGLTAYLELRKHLPKSSPEDPDHEITIYEAYSTGIDETPESRTEGSTESMSLLVGGGLGVEKNGLGVLKRLDEKVLRDVTLLGHVLSHYNMKDKNGGLLMRLEPPKNTDGTSPSLLMLATTRHALWRSLRVHVPDEHIIQKKVSEVIAQPNARNVVRFEDGSEPVEADLVIGADGIRSTTRTALFPVPEDCDRYAPRYEGLVGITGSLPAAEVEGLIEAGSTNFIFGRTGFVGYYSRNSADSAPHRDSPYHVSPPGDLVGWWTNYATKEYKDHKNIDLEDVRKQLTARFSEWKDPVVQKILQCINLENTYTTFSLPQIPSWHREGVVLIGDAAHALPQSAIQGSSQAFEDCECFALFLAHHLRKAKTPHTPMTIKSAIKAASKQYVALRQPRVKEILEITQRKQKSKRDMGSFSESLMYIVMRITGYFQYYAESDLRMVNSYNIAQEVERVLESDK